MKKNAGSFVLLICGVLAICMIGCGSLEEDTTFVSADPPSGSDILPDNTVTVTFDNTPVTVDVEIQGHPQAVVKLERMVQSLLLLTTTLAT